MSVYAFSDLHGMYKLYEQIKSFLKPEDKVYFLGDANDRGPQGWKCIVSLLKDPQFIYLKGNHEQMLVEAMQDYRDSDIIPYYSDCFYNGGANTFNDWLNDTHGNCDYIRPLMKLPHCSEYINKSGQTIWLSHSGCPPFRNVHSQRLTIPERLALWDREHIWVPNWGDDELDEDLIIVHGHTPIPYFFEGMNIDIELSPGAFWYCQDHKVCLDNGSFATGVTVLLDLDTFDEHIFSVDVE